MLKVLATPEEIRTAAGGDLLVAHLLTRWVAEPRSSRHGGAVAVWSDFWGQPEMQVVGPPRDAAQLLDLVTTAGQLDGLPEDTGVSIPEAAVALLPTDFPLQPLFRWAFRWTDRPPPRAPAPDAARWLREDEAGDVVALLDRGFPDASMRPGDPHLRRWAGIRQDGRLVACLGDATADPAMGFVASITSDPELRGRGYGATISAWATEALRREHGRVALWHMGDNARADALYTALGYRDDHRMVVVGPPLRIG